MASPDVPASTEVPTATSVPSPTSTPEPTSTVAIVQAPTATIETPADAVSERPGDRPQPTKTPAPTKTPEPTDTPTVKHPPTATATPKPPTATSTPKPPTATAAPKPPTATATPKPPTATPKPATATPKPPTATPKPPTPTTSTGVIIDSAAENYALTLINNSRAQAGKAALVMSSAVRSVARAHAQDMATRNYFSHTSPEGLRVWDRLDRAGIGWSYLSENLGFGQGYGTPSDAVRAMHNSMMAEVAPNDGHKKNILNSLAGRVGIGVAKTASNKVYYVCNFIN
jgi:uncharacterized protein YkwD